MMINNDNENSTDTVTTATKSNPISSDENISSMSPTDDLNKPNGEEQSVQIKNNDLNGNENESQDNQLIPVGEGEQNTSDDEFIRITAAHQMLTEAQTYDEQKNYPAALHLYRICVDLLLEELMFTEGTDQSRIYLREKCTAVMDRIDLLKTMLEPISPPPPPPPSAEIQSEPEQPLALPPITTTTIDEQPTINEQTTKPPTDELNSLHLS